MVEVECRTLAGESWCVVLTNGSRVSDLRVSLGLDENSGKLFAGGVPLDDETALPPSSVTGGALVVHVVPPSPLHKELPMIVVPPASGLGEPVIEEPESPGHPSAQEKTLFPLAARKGGGGGRRAAPLRAWVTLIIALLVGFAIAYRITGFISNQVPATKKEENHSYNGVKMLKPSAKMAASSSTTSSTTSSPSSIIKSSPEGALASSAAIAAPVSYGYGWAAVYGVGYSMTNRSSMTGVSSTTSQPQPQGAGGVRPLLLLRGLAIADSSGERGSVDQRALSRHESSFSMPTWRGMGTNAETAAAPAPRADRPILEWRRVAKAVLIVPAVSAAVAMVVRPAAKHLLAALILAARKWLPRRKCDALARYASRFVENEHDVEAAAAWRARFSCGDKTL